MAQSRENVRKPLQDKKRLADPPNYNNDNNINTAIATSLKTRIKIEPKPEEQPTTSLIAEKCGWDQTAPSAKNIEEDWDGDHQKQLQQWPQPQVQMAKNAVPSGPELLETPGFQFKKHLMFLIGTQVS